MNWNLAQLQAFTATVQQGSFSAAARHLNRAQSRVSTAIANLEIDIGFELFDRSARYPVLTARGESLYPQALKILKQCQALDSQINTLAREQEVALTLAMDEAFPEQVAEKAMRFIERKYPHFCLTLINGSQGDIVDYVKSEQADLGLLVQSNPVDDSLYKLEIGQLNYQLIAAKSHPLSKLENVSREDLEQHRQYVSCNKQGEPYNKPHSGNCWYLDSYFYILPLVIAGGGWAMLPQNIAQHPMFIAELKVLQVAGFNDQPFSNISIIRRAESPSGEISECFIQQLQQHL